MGNCKDCRSWTYYNDVWDKEWHECLVDVVDLGTPVGEAEAAVYAEASDDSLPTAGLVTGPMFGCVQFQLRPLIEEGN